MVREAEQHAAEDRTRKESAELHNEADTLAYSAEKTLKDLGDKVPANLRTDVEQKVSAVREALNGSDMARLRQRKDELQQVLQQVGAAAYQQGGRPSAARRRGSGPMTVPWTVSSARSRLVS